MSTREQILTRIQAEKHSVLLNIVNSCYLDIFYPNMLNMLRRENRSPARILEKKTCYRSRGLIYDSMFMKLGLNNYLDNIEAIYESWNATDNPTTPVPYRPCMPIDFGLDELEATEKQFFDVSEAKKPEVSRVLHRLNCIDQRLDLYGDWNSGSA